MLFRTIHEMQKDYGIGFIFSAQILVLQRNLVWVECVTILKLCRSFISERIQKYQEKDDSLFSAFHFFK